MADLINVCICGKLGDAQVAIGGGDFEPHETIPAENWNRRLQQV